MEGDLFQTSRFKPVRFFTTAKVKKNITVDDLKRRPVIDQTNAYIYTASKVVAKYLKPLAKNEFTISDTLSFLSLLKSTENSDDYEDVSYDVVSLFTSIPVKETIEYILHKRYDEKLIKPMCKISISKKLLMKLTRTCIFCK